MSTHPEGKSCSDLGRVLVHDDPPAGPERPNNGHFRGAWLETAGRNRAPRGAKLGTKTTKQLIEAHGAEEYEFYVAFHVQKHLTLGRHISSWWGAASPNVLKPVLKAPGFSA